MRVTAILEQTPEAVVSIVDGDDTADPAAVQSSGGPVLLVRYRPGIVGETARTVHVVASPTDGRVDGVGARCGAVLLPGEIEAVAPGEGMPCAVCVLHCVADTALDETPPSSGLDRADPARPVSSGVTYQQWGWPVTLHRDQVRLSLDRGVSALMIPIGLGAEVIPVLIRQRCAPPVLAHPYALEHHIVLTGERYGIRLPWPEQVHQVTGVVLLPPTRTPRGPITWITTPQSDSLHLCREIDLFAALRSTVNSETPPETCSSIS